MTKIRKPTSLDMLLMLLTILAWSGAFQAIKIAVGDFHPLTVALLRASIGFLTVLPYALWIGLRFPQGLKQWGLVIATGLLNISIPFTLINWGETRITSSEAALMMGMGPFFAMALAHLTTEDDKLNRHKFIGVIVGFIGVLFVILPDLLNKGGSGDIWGLFACGLASACYVIAGTIVRRIYGIPAGVLALFSLGVAGITLGILQLFLGIGIPEAPSQGAILAILFLGIIPTGIAYVIRYYLINNIGYSFFALSIYMLPPMGVLLGVLLLNDPLSWNILIAIAFIGLGLVIAKRGAAS